MQGGHLAEALIGRATLALVVAPQQPLADHLSGRALLTAAHAAHCLHCCHALLQTCPLECNSNRVVSPPGSQLQSTCTVVNGTGVWSQPTSSCAPSKLVQHQWSIRAYRLLHELALEAHTHVQHAGSRHFSVQTQAAQCTHCCRNHPRHDMTCCPAVCPLSLCPPCPPSLHLFATRGPRSCLGHARQQQLQQQRWLGRLLQWNVHRVSAQLWYWSACTPAGA